MTGEVYVGSDSESYLSQGNSVNLIPLILSYVACFYYNYTFICYLSYAQDGYLDTVI